ncbi:MAG: DNA translocase FtsK 4TM domain-containing protein [Bacteroidales bacterium]|nr:DNA translocase FtsK 4TM domain-containing protein [Bacteroidales bacterium]
MRKDTTFNPDLTGVQNETRREQEAKKQAEEQELTFRMRLSSFVHDRRTRGVIGAFFGMVGMFLLVAFISFCAGAGDIDQSITADSAIENARQGVLSRNMMGTLGASVSEFFIRQGYGLASFVLVIWCFCLAYRFIRKNKKVLFFSFSVICLFSLFAFSLIISACTDPFHLASFPLGGHFGKEFNQLLTGLLGEYGMWGVNFFVFFLWVVITYKTIRTIYHTLKERIIPHRQFNGEIIEPKPNQPVVQPTFLGDDHKAEPQKVQPVVVPPVKKRKQQSQKDNTVLKEGGDPKTGTLFASAEGELYKNDPTYEYAHYRFPPLDLLAPATMGVSVDASEQEANKQRITETLNNYGIRIKKIEVHVGPTVTLFEIVPEDGVRIAKIRNLEDDIALSLAALGIRIIAPMPGRGTIGIEVPNRDPQVVPIRRALEDPKFRNTKYKLPMAIGCTVSNEMFVADLAKMPHLLVAGATGKGKSVGLNTIIASLLYTKGPSELKMILVDPKRVEFSVYADLEKYYFARVPGEDRCIVTDPAKVVKTLNCLVQEMENRYSVLEEVKVRKLEDYNDKWRRELREVLDANGKKKYRFMPYIVCIIDEFADMIMTSGKEVETPIVRIAQKARAVGIHLIVATQRPAANVITGNIKANIPGRMAFAVSQMMDSRIILDRPGAQNLIGRGDMLFSVDGDITRLQCPFIDTPEIIKICDYIKAQEDADLDVNHEEPYELPEYVGGTDGDSEGYGGGAGGNLNDRDPLFEEAARLVVTASQASTSSLQRRYNIGYNRAGRIMDQLEAAGIVGPSNGGKPRSVLMSPMDVDQMFATTFKN